MAQLTIVRKKEFINYFRNYRIVIDGKEAGKVANGQTKVFDLSDGQHTIQAGVDWCKTPPKEISVSEDKKVSLTVGGFAHSQLIFKIFAAIMVVHLSLKYLIQFEYTMMFFLPFALVLFYYLTFGRKGYLQMQEIA